MTSRQLYEYIWALNIFYLNHPNINTSNFWWNQQNKNLEKEKENENKKNEENINVKNCYPFVLRYSEVSENNDNINLIHCPLCPWYSFCPGCIINPNDDLKRITSNFGIVVDWCYSFIQEEFTSFNFQLYKEIDNKNILNNLPEDIKKFNILNIKECLNSFFDEKILENPIYCQYCMKPEKFYKKYILKTLPDILVLSLKRFHIVGNNIIKLKQMIDYPLYDFELVNKKYDLYGVINHNGTFNTGHYYAVIKIKNSWIVCDDEKIYQIEENKVMNKNAYILFYISKDFPNISNNFIKYIISDLNNTNK